jgi:hypothetical protein
VPGEIYDIPPSAPVYPTTYVYVYDADPDWVTYGYLRLHVRCGHLVHGHVRAEHGRLRTLWRDRS